MSNILYPLYLKKNIIISILISLIIILIIAAIITIRIKLIHTQKEFPLNTVLLAPNGEKYIVISHSVKTIFVLHSGRRVEILKETAKTWKVEGE